MNTLDIITLVILSLSVLICAIKGFLKIIAHFGAFCVAMIASKLLGGWLGETFLGEALGGFASAIGTLVLFVLLLLLCRIIFTGVAKLITKVLKTKALDKVLGAIVGLAGGVAGIYVFSLVLGVVVSVISLIGVESALPAMIDSTLLLKYFM